MKTFNWKQGFRTLGSKISNGFETIVKKTFGKSIAKIASLESKLIRLGDRIGEVEGKSIGYSNRIDVLENKLTPEKIRNTSDPNLFEQDGIKIRFSSFPNKDMAAFHVSKPLPEINCTNSKFVFPNKEADHVYPSEAANMGLNLLTELLFRTNLCVEVYIKPFCVDFTKSGASTWDEVIPEVNKAIWKYFENCGK